MLISLTAFAATGMGLRFIDVESFLPSNAYYSLSFFAFVFFLIFSHVLLFRSTKILTY
jgi:hypothetical protein